MVVSTNHPPGQRSLLPFMGQEMSTGQSAVMCCGCWGVKAGSGWLIPFVDIRVGSRLNYVIPR